jgi:signal transduction histidine kinase
MNRVRAALAANPLLVDAVIAVGLAALSLFAFVSGAPDVGPPGELTVALLLTESLPLVVRRRYPLAVMLVIVGATVVHIVTIPAGGELRSGLGMLVAVYTVAERLDRRTSLALTALTGLVIGFLIVQRAALPADLQGIIQTEVVLGVAWLVGDASRVRRLYTASLESQKALLEREREERDRLAVLEERERIARELHDAVTHHVSVVVIQAGGALRALDRRPEEARTALEAIDVTARQALTDMRRMIGILGEQEGQGPMPGLDRIGDLLEQVRAAGLAVELSIIGERRRLDPGVELSAYRIVQEALTNSLKHAGGGRARVSIHYAADALELSVEDERGTDAPPAVEPDHEGRGLLGMRERVAMFHGAFSAAATATGFRVTANLPIDGAPAS